MTLVMKFGGTSVGSAQAVQNTAELILNAREAWGSVAVVASAMGTKPVKVTDLLLEGATTAFTGDGETYKKTAAQLRQIHYETIDALLAPERERQLVLAENNLFIDRFEDICKAILVLGELTPRALDVVGGMGEQMSVRILAAYLRQLGHKAEAVDATDLIVTDANFQNAAPLFDLTVPQTQARLQPLLDEGSIPVVTGFIAANEAGVTTTLGRGGSDYSAAILGQCLSAQEVWIWTDVDGVMTADPRIAHNAKSIPVLSYREVSELAFYGAKVLHPKTMRPCVENNIPLRIKNTFNPNHPGTVIVPDNGSMNGGAKAVTAIKHLSLITVEGKGMLGIPGIAARTFGAVAKSNVSVLLISQASSEQSICFATPEASAEQVIAALEVEFVEEIKRQDVDRVWAMHDVTIVTIVGAGMRGTPGISGGLFTALGDHHVNIIAIAQGSSECSISLVIEGRETAAAVRHIHEVIVG